MQPYLLQLVQNLRLTVQELYHKQKFCYNLKMKKFLIKLTEDKTASKLFLLPAVLGTFVFIVIPVFFSFVLSFCEWDLIS